MNNLIGLSSKEIEDEILRVFKESRERGLIDWTHEIYRSSDSSLMFTATLTYAGGETQQFLVKGVLHGLDIGSEVGELLSSTLNAELHNLPVGEPILYSYKDVMREGGGRGVRELVTTPLTCVYPGSISLHPQKFFPDTITLHDYFREMRTRTRLEQRDRAIITMVSQSFKHLHSHIKIPFALRDKNSQLITNYSREQRNRIYNRSLNELSTRFEHYKGTSPEHPVLSKNKLRDTREFLDDLKAKWHDRGDRLGIIIGDAHGMNILLTLSKATGMCIRLRFIDAHHRMMLFDPAYDIGRLRFDCLQWFLLTDNPVYLQWGDSLLEVHSGATADVELGAASNMGLVSRIPWAICPENSRNKPRLETGPDPNPQFDPEYGLRLFNTALSHVAANKSHFILP